MNYPLNICNLNMNLFTQGSWRFEGDSFPSIQELIITQHESNQPVTKKSSAVLKTPIFREEWELNNDDIETSQKIGNVSIVLSFTNIYAEIIWLCKWQSNFVSFKITLGVYCVF